MGESKKLLMYQKNGFTLTEIIVTIGLFAFLLVGISQLLVHNVKQNKDLVVESSINEFHASFGQYLHNYCKTAFMGKTFPYNRNSPVDLIIDHYRGFGNINEIKKDTTIFKKGKIISLTWQHNKNFPDKTVTKNGVDYKVVSGKIAITPGLKLRDGGIKPFPPYYIENFFFINPSSYKVFDCMIEIEEKDICDTIGYDYDSTQKKCAPKRNCFVSTSFVNCTSNRGTHPTYTPSSPCNKLILPQLTTGSETHYIHYYTNDEGGSLGTCPPGTTATISGKLTGSDSQDCGKKCTNHYSSTATIYLCMQCN